MSYLDCNVASCATCNTLEAFARPLEVPVALCTSLSMKLSAQTEQVLSQQGKADKGFIYKSER
jgi:hypothetical protein